MSNHNPYFTNFLKKTNIKIKDEFLNIYKCMNECDNMLQINMTNFEERIKSLEQYQAGILDKLSVFTEMLDDLQKRLDDFQKRIDIVCNFSIYTDMLNNIQKQLSGMKEYQQSLLISKPNTI